MMPRACGNFIHLAGRTPLRGESNGDAAEGIHEDPDNDRQHLRSFHLLRRYRGVHADPEIHRVQLVAATGFQVEKQLCDTPHTDR